MRAILDLRTNKVLRNCGSSASAARTFAMLQIERDKHRDLCKRTYRTMPESRDFKLGICEVQGLRNIGNVVPESEFTIIHAEK